MIWSELPKDKLGRKKITKTRFSRPPSEATAYILAHPHVKQSKVPVIGDMRGFNKGSTTGLNFLPGSIS